MRSLSILALLVLLLAACGGGSGGPDDPAAGTGVGSGGGGNTGGGGGGGGGLLPNPGPQIALLLCNGHSPLPNYLATATGPQLEGALLGAGYTVQTSYFTDDLGGGAPGGYTDLVAKLQQIRDDWINGRSNPTRVVVVGHSHGCVRSHAALRAVSDCPIRLLVDLDGSSAGWTLVTHGPENAAMGGAPEGAYNINATITCSAFPTVASAPPPFDLEDVVFTHVEEAYEVRSADMLIDPSNPPQLIPYDDRWNARPDGTTGGLTCYYSGLSHLEAGSPGVTLNAVQAWMLARLAAD
ncbi:MAG: hypothetical protein P1V36_02020 [Planctomycetota bacterium]|nr:hypothetical protein [Planctomycetota bacterium]